MKTFISAYMRKGKSVKAERSIRERGAEAGLVGPRRVAGMAKVNVARMM